MKLNLFFIVFFSFFAGMDLARGWEIFYTIDVFLVAANLYYLNKKYQKERGNKK